MNYQLIQGDCLQTLKTLPAESVQTCVTSPPYYGLRSYLDSDDEDKHLEVGTEETPEQYVAKLVDVFREVRRVLRDDGTLFLNLGDSYAGSGGAGEWSKRAAGKQEYAGPQGDNPNRFAAKIGLKPKDLIGIPWMVAFALRADGWWLRSDIIWHKPNPMPESVTDRPTKSHEYIFLLSKSPNYYYDADAVREENSETSGKWGKSVVSKTAQGQGGRHGKSGFLGGEISHAETIDRYYTNGRNRRSVWTVTTKPYSGAHFAVFPEALIEPCILAGTSAHGACAKCGSPWARVIEKIGKSMPVSERHGRVGHNGQPPQISGMYWDGPTTKATEEWQPTCACGCTDVVPQTVLDPFAGSGTTLAVALKHGRHGIGLELNEDYITLSHDRIRKSQPMLLEAL